MKIRRSVIISQLPDFEGREWTEAQVAHRERFRQAALYGKMVFADQEQFQVAG